MPPIQHKDITGTDALHPFAVISASDPGAIGADKGWIDTSFSPPRLKYRNALNSAWVTYTGADGADGADGVDGTDGTDGVDGVGVPAGGTIGQVLAKNSGTNYDTEWVDPPTGGATDLEGLTDVDLTSPTTGQVLKYNGSQWVNDTDGGSGATDLEGLSDVDLTSPTTGQVLKYNGSQWVNDTDGGSGATDLEGLSDVDLTSPTTGQILKYNGSQWVNDTAPGGSSIGVFNPDVPYTSPSTEDDEFNAGSLNGKWTAISGVTAPTLNWDIPNFVGGKRGASGQLSGYYQSVSNTSCSFRAKITNNLNAVNGSVGIFLGESGPHFTSIRFDGTQIVVEEWINATSVYLAKATVTIASNGYTAPDIYLDLTYNGTSCVASISTNGVDFSVIYTNSTAFPFGGTLDRAGIFWYGGASSPTRFARIDWFRKLQGNYTGANV